MTVVKSHGPGLNSWLLLPARDELSQWHFETSLGSSWDHYSPRWQASSIYWRSSTRSQAPCRCQLRTSGERNLSNFGRAFWLLGCSIERISSIDSNLVLHAYRPLRLRSLVAWIALLWLPRHVTPWVRWLSRSPHRRRTGHRGIEHGEGRCGHHRYSPYRNQYCRDSDPNYIRTMRVGVTIARRTCIEQCILGPKRMVLSR